jgi:hypothetical protein
MVVNEDYSLDFEVCMKCDGYGYIYGDDNADRVPKCGKFSEPTTKLDIPP